MSQPPDLGRSRIVDLTLLVAEELPCWWSTHMPYQHKTFNYFADIEDQARPLLNRTGPYQTRWMLMDEHTGTHLDAPAHFLPGPGTGLPHASAMGEVTVDQVPLAQIAGPAVLVDASSGLPDAAPGESPAITADRLIAHERAHGQFQAGEIVLLQTQWDQYYAPGPAGSRYVHDALVTRTGPGWPAPDATAMEVLLERGVRCVGTDGPSMGSSHDGAPVHQVGLAGGAVFVEALCNLGELPRTGAWFCFAPLKVARGTGAPGRAFAFVDGAS